MTREETIKWLESLKSEIGKSEHRALWHYAEAIDMAIESLQTEPKWITDRKPTESGTYMVTLESVVRDRVICLMHYGKPMMPNRKVRGTCWYRSDDEWGDIVYDDKDILAWMPLPKPYKENNV